ncbi:MAG: paraslipin [Spirochaetaceae bacterium]|nr:MAG: paraslipin [Spirochaetaceae bacterium]
MMTEVLIYTITAITGFFVVIGFFKSIRIVAAQTALVVERLGKYRKTLGAGFHLLAPFLDKVRYHHSLKERAIDVPSQRCITNDNVRMEVNGILYLKVVDPKKASYGIENYLVGVIQLAQTTMRSVIGKLDLDRTFEERVAINGHVVKSVDEASEAWGVKVTRYEIKNIDVPKDILHVMEVQMESERIKRAKIAESEGKREARINYSLGVMSEAINKSEGQKQRWINEAEGKACEIESIAKSTALGIRKVAEAMTSTGGEDAVALRIAESYIGELQKLAKKSTELILPLDLANIKSIMDTVTKILRQDK